LCLLSDLQIQTKPADSTTTSPVAVEEQMDQESSSQSVKNLHSVFVKNGVVIANDDDND